MAQSGVSEVVVGAGIWIKLEQCSYPEVIDHGTKLGLGGSKPLLMQEQFAVCIAIAVCAESLFDAREQPRDDTHEHLGSSLDLLMMHNPTWPAKGAPARDHELGHASLAKFAAGAEIRANLPEPEIEGVSLRLKGKVHTCAF